MRPRDDRPGRCVQCSLLATLDTDARCPACAAIAAAHKEVKR